jgi:hypothetical protein
LDKQDLLLLGRSGKQAARSRLVELNAIELLMTHKYRRSQQSSSEVKFKFIDSTQGKLKNICKS